MDEQTIRNHLIKAGVRNLKEFGYPDVDESNILTDSVYSAFFAVMLEENKGQSDKVDEQIRILLEGIGEKS